MADGQEYTSWLHQSVAWCAARAIAQHTHADAVLYGQYGIARFNRLGGGVVEWLVGSLKPGEKTTFDARTTVCI
jgi:hypothetical protein